MDHRVREEVEEEEKKGGGGGGEDDDDDDDDEVQNGDTHKYAQTFKRQRTLTCKRKCISDIGACE
jgi:hypothetical protein